MRDAATWDASVDAFVACLATVDGAIKAPLGRGSILRGVGPPILEAVDAPNAEGGRARPTVDGAGKAGGGMLGSILLA